MEQPLVPESTVAAVRDDLRAALEPISIDLAEAGSALLDRLAPPSCTFEWGIARWLGDAFGLPQAVVYRLTLSNMLGLAYVCLQDDLADGEVPSGRVVPTVCLTTILYEQALRDYGRLFPAHSPFWTFLQTYLGDWTRATLFSHTPRSVSFPDYGEQDFARMAWKGAPRKTACAAACLLAGQEQSLAPLSTALDHLMSATVLLDDAHDWMTDLSAGHHNEFVAYATSARQVPELCEANRLAVLKVLCLGDRGEGYFALLRRQLRLALAVPQARAVPGLAQYLSWLDEWAGAFAREVGANARLALRSAAQQILGSLPADACQSGQQKGA